MALTKLVVLAFENLNDHEMKENIIPPNYGDLIKAKNPVGSTPNPFNNRVTRRRGDTRHGMSPFNTVASLVYDAGGVRLVNEVLQIQGNMAGTGRTGPGMKLIGSKIFLLARSTKVHHCLTNGL